MTQQLENIADVYALSPTQQGMLFHTVSAEEPGVYLVQMAVNLDGLEDPDRLAATLQHVCSRHDSLKSFYVWEDVEQPLQIVREKVDFPVKRLDWRDDSPDQQRQNLLSLVKRNQQTGIEPNDDPLLRFFLCRCDEEKYTLVFFFHHLILDGWSTQTLLTEILNHYDRPLTEAPAFQFRDYIAYMSQRDVEAETKFWQTELVGFSKPNHIGPPDIGSSTSTEHHQTSRFLSAQQTRGLRDFARANRITLSTLVRGLWSLTVSRFSGGDRDIVFGVTNAGRPPELIGIESSIGSFINTIPFRTQIDPNLSLSDWLQGLQVSQGRTSPWETSSLLNIQKEANFAGSRDLFQSILVFENYPQRDTSTNSLSIVGTEHFEQSSYPLAILVVPDDELEFIFVHDRNRFPDAFIGHVAQQLQWLAERIVANPQQNLGFFCGVEDGQRSISGARNVEGPPTPFFMDQLLSAHAFRNPDDIAISFKGETTTYGELEVQANQIANHLNQLGVGPNDLVGICLERSPNMLAGIFGILKSGGAYVPIDPSYPAAHIAHIVKDADPKVVLTTAAHSAALPPDANTVNFDDVLSPEDSAEV